jgi:hypothetical protein
MRAAWEASTYATSTTYRRREEWDWCYRSDYCGAPPSRGAGARGACARRAAELLSHQLISTGPKLQSMGGGGVGGGGGIRGVTRSGGGKGLDSRDSWLTAATGAEPAAPTAAPTAPASECALNTALKWCPCTEAEAEATAGASSAWEPVQAEAGVLTERTIKLYEDHLAELGLSQMTVRLREFEHGWEVRVRWYCVLNPGQQPRRGVPHARLRDTTFRMRYQSGALVRVAEERCLYFGGGGVDERGVGGGEGRRLVAHAKIPIISRVRPETIVPPAQELGAS